MLQAASLPNRIKAFYERASAERAAALVELPELYAEQIHFINPVSDERGLAAFRDAWEEALRKYKVFQFHDIEVVGTDEQFSLTYSMTIAFGVGPSFTTNMATACRAENGKVVYLRDYFDPLGTLVQPIGPLHWCYRKIFRVLVA
jgi:ketosteroid isomerase-like protein